MFSIQPDKVILPLSTYLALNPPAPPPKNLVIVEMAQLPSLME